MLASNPTDGLFPANLAVTRVAAENLPEGSANRTEPILLADPRNEFLQWNSTLDDQMAVSEVFPVAQRDLGGGDAEPGQILAAFRALHARLGLIYAVNDLSPNETEMFGMLYDTTNSTPVAAFHAQATSTTPPGEEKDCGRHDPFDVWEKDSRALVRAEFAKQLHASIRELILNDQPRMMDAPEGWKPEVSARSVAWPPRRKAIP